MHSKSDTSHLRRILYAAVILILGGILGYFASLQINKPNALPVPKAASNELQNAIKERGATTHKRLKPTQPMTDAQWRKRISIVNEQSKTSVDQINNKYNVAVSSDSIANVPVFRVKSKIANLENDAVFIHLHGGGYVYYEGVTGLPEAAIIAAFTGMDVVAIDYRMPPDHPHPAALNDVEAVYRELLKSYPPSKIAMGGTSAGAGLALASIHQFKSQNLQIPGALFAGTPWADLTDTSDTLSTLEGVDRILVSYNGHGSLFESANLYAAGTPLTDPLISPIYGDFDGFPPTYLVSGTRDLFLSDTIRTHRKLKESGVITDLNIYEGMSHADYLIVQNSPEFGKVYSGLAKFLEQNLHTNPD